MEVNYEKLFVNMLLAEWYRNKNRLIEEFSKELSDLDLDNNDRIFYIIFNPVREVQRGKTKFVCKWASSATLPLMEMNTSCIKVDSTGEKTKCEFLWMLPKGCQFSLNPQIKKWYELYVYAKLTARQAYNVDNSGEYVDKSAMKDLNQRLYKMRLLAMKADKTSLIL